MSSDFTRSEQFELWADLSKQNTHLRRNNWLHWAAHLVLLAAVFLLATRPLTAVRVDSLGKADLVQNIAPSNAPGPEEAEAVSRLVAQYLMELQSGSVSRDLGRALTLMSADFAKAYRAKVAEDQTLTTLDKANVRSQLTFDPNLTQVRQEKDPEGRPVRYLVQLGAKLELYRADVFTSPLASHDVVLRATLLVVPRTPTTLNGLLVQFFEHELLTPRARPTSPAPTPSPVPAVPSPAVAK
ncbi:hypothetical protein [Corallococcus sp. AB038B]|uniref:hypothetical protein n=1 Tax=Corallococcus sp. AB038B TaxID=2316718 RepID=UPI000EE0F680|nr:hypothetical protein [Corallococcus sp. AB038B]RKH92977.1 hypothetical protein D7Y04_41890 [Corallococcus sp. AB038B]